MTRLRILAAGAILSVASSTYVAARPSHVWTWADQLAGDVPSATSDAMYQACHIQYRGPAYEACANFFYANGRAPDADEVKLQIAADERMMQSSAIPPSSPVGREAVTQVRARLRADLRDPDSAKFRNEHVVLLYGRPFVCGEMNATNAFGGYVGYTPYMLSPTESEISMGVALAEGKHLGTTWQCAYEASSQTQAARISDADSPPTFTSNDAPAKASENISRSQPASSQAGHPLAPSRFQRFDSWEVSNSPGQSSAPTADH